MNDTIKMKEEKIKNLLTDNIKVQRAFNKMMTFYEVFDKLYLTTHTKLLKAIYLDDKNYSFWELSNVANICYSTCFEYRNNYVKCFYLCLDELSN